MRNPREALRLHRWDVTPAEARALQEKWRGRVVRRGSLDAARIHRVAGADVAFQAAGRGGVAIAGVVLFSYPEWKELESAAAFRPLTFPYVPGLLSFREIPAILDALAGLREAPDVILCDGQGYAHPRRFGLASHLGVLLDVPSIGCAKSRLIGEHAEPGPSRGCWTPLMHQGERIGAAVRTRAGSRPMYISVGHRVSLAGAIRLALRACDPSGRSRIPRPTERADRYVAEIKRRRADAREAPEGAGEALED
jgi:deoxyribonuclease V